MAEPNWKNRTLFHADNLDVLRNMNSESVDLIATDPPFNRSKDFHATPDSLAKGASFHDRWSWKEHVHEDWVKQLREHRSALVEVIESGVEAHSPSMGAYLCYMSVRLMEMHRVLKSTGSMYLHCDPTASHYLKACLDAIFGARQFQNEIIWHYGLGAFRATSRYPRKHDILLFYTKSYERSHTFNVQRGEPTKQMLAKYRHHDDKGRYMVSYGKKYYLKGGKPFDTVWNIASLSSTSKERTGYPTQKPLRLYERIIEASSNEGDVVFDPFAGCATTCIAAERLGRQWVGVDIWQGAHDVVIKRMERQVTLHDHHLQQGGTARTSLFTADFVFTSELPRRTDGGDLAAMELPALIGYGKRKKRPWERVPEGAMRKQLLSAQKHPHVRERYLCAGCGRTLEGPFLDMDHINPKADGGKDTIDNRILLCRPCNIKKKHKYTLNGLWIKNKEDLWMEDHALARRVFLMVQNLAKRLQHEMR